MTKDATVLASLDRVFSKDHYEYFNDELAMSVHRTAAEIEFLRCKVGLQSSSTVLDVACGNGRHLIALAPHVRLGLGIDSNEEFINDAKRKAAGCGSTNVVFQCGDARSLPTTLRFDYVMMLNGIFGVFGEQADLGIMRAARKRLKRGGHFVFNIPNRDTVMREFSEDFVYERDGDLMIDRCSFDSRTGYITNRRIYIKDGRRLDAPFSYRVYNYTEIERMLTATGLGVKCCYGDWVGDQVQGKSPRLIFVSQRTD